MDQHRVPGQLDAAGHALPVSEELRGLSRKTPRLPDRCRTRISVQLRLLTTNGKFEFLNCTFKNVEKIDLFKVNYPYIYSFLFLEVEV